MTAPSRLLLVPSALLGLGLLAGCGGSGDTATNSGSSTPPVDRPGPGATLGPTTSPSPSPPGSSPGNPPGGTATPDPAPGQPVAPPAPPEQPTSDNLYVARCEADGAARSRLEALAPRTRVVTDEESGSKLPVTVAGRGDTVLVVLHDARGSACGAQEFLAAAGDDNRFRVVAADLCMSPAARCVGELMLDDAAQTGLVLDWVHEQFDPDKVVVMGVGTGGTAAVQAASIGLPADAVVNVSGAAPAADIRRVTVPMLHLHEDLSGADAAGARKVAREGSRRVSLEGVPASGWEALTDDVRLTGVGREALDFAGR